MLSLSTRVLVYDASHLQCELLTAGLKSLDLGFTVQAATDYNGVVSLLIQDANWVVLLAESSTSTNTMAVARQLRERFDSIPFVFVLSEGRIDRVVEAFRAGARGIVYSNENLGRLADCITRVQQGEICVREGDLSTILDGLLKPNPRITDATGRALLSPREEEISRLVAEGMSNREVARTLKISESTVKNSLFHVFEKLGISNRVELARYINGSPELNRRALQ